MEIVVLQLMRSLVAEQQCRELLTDHVSDKAVDFRHRVQ